MKKRIKIISLMIITMLIFSLVGCDNSDKIPQKPTARGFAWEATKGDTTVTLVGTMHPAPTTHKLLTDELAAIVDNSDVLWVELDLTSKENMDKLEKSYYLKAGEKIEDYLSKEDIAELTSILKSYNVKINQVETYNSFALTSLINNFVAQDIEFTGFPLDSLMVDEAKRKNVEIKEVEGVDYQINVLSKLYTWDMLEEAIATFEDGKQMTIEQSNILFQNYVEGNVEAADKYENESKGVYDEDSYKILIVDRNIGMVEKINKYMTDGKKHTLAVGYRHFMGDDSIIKLLEAEGYTITRIN